MRNQKSTKFAAAFMVFASVAVYGVSQYAGNDETSTPKDGFNNSADLDLNYKYQVVLRDGDYDKAALEEILGDVTVQHYNGYAYITTDVENLAECNDIRLRVATAIDWDAETSPLSFRPYACTVNNVPMSEGQYRKINDDIVVIVPPRFKI